MKRIFLIFFMIVFVPRAQAEWNGDLVKTYFHNSEMQREWAQELLGKHPLKGDETVLDYGSGDGKISALMSRLLPAGSVTGVDLSQDMVHFAHLKFPPYVYRNLKFVKTDPTFSDFYKNEEFDLITSFCVLHLVKDPDPLLQNLKKHLKQEGKLIAVIPCDAGPVFFQAARETLKKYDKKSSHIQIPIRSIEGCREIFEKAGFEIVSLECVDSDNSYYDMQELISWMIGTVTAVWNIAFEDTQAFFKELTDHMLFLDPDMIDEEGRVTLKWARLHVVAVKK